MIDHIAKVIPAGVIAVGNMFEISAWVIPPIRYGDPGILTTDVKAMTRRDVMRRRYAIYYNSEVINSFGKSET